VDIMNDFASPGGAYLKMGYSSLTDEQREVLVSNNQRLIKAMRAVGRPIVYVRGEYRADDLDSAQSWIKKKTQTFTSDAPFKIIGSWGPQIIDELAPSPEDVVIVKKGHSGFGFTELAPVLQHLGVDTCVATGGGSPGCLSDTVREGAGWGYDFLVVGDAAYSANHPILKDLSEHCGSLTTTEEVLEMLKVAVEA
jgi:ureidoacrylate peracid hydrolase